MLHLFSDIIESRGILNIIDVAQMYIKSLKCLNDLNGLMLLHWNMKLAVFAKGGEMTAVQCLEDIWPVAVLTISVWLLKS